MRYAFKAMHSWQRLRRKASLYDAEQLLGRLQQRRAGPAQAPAARHWQRSTSSRESDVLNVDDVWQAALDSGCLAMPTAKQLREENRQDLEGLLQVRAPLPLGDST